MNEKQLAPCRICRIRLTQKLRRSRLGRICNSCKRRAYKKKYPERAREAKKRYYAKYPEKRREKNRKRKARMKPYLRAKYNRTYYLKHLDYFRAYAEKHRDHILAERERNHEWRNICARRKAQYERLRAIMV